jgi:hypothetical protein
VLDYEFNLPLIYSLGPYTFRVAYAFIVPLNILDGSTSTPFGVLSVEASMTIR